MIRQRFSARLGARVAEAEGERERDLAAPERRHLGRGVRREPAAHLRGRTAAQRREGVGQDPRSAVGDSEREGRGRGPGPVAVERGDVGAACEEGDAEEARDRGGRALGDGTKHLRSSYPRGPRPQPDEKNDHVRDNGSALR